MTEEFRKRVYGKKKKVPWNFQVDSSDRCPVITLYKSEPSYSYKEWSLERALAECKAYLIEHPAPFKLHSDYRVVIRIFVPGDVCKCYSMSFGEP